jgi:predicted nucleic acid-binding protein
MKIFDTSSLICFLREIGFPKALDTCIGRGYRLTTTQQVYGELQKNPATFRAFTAYGKVSVIPVNDDPCFAKLSKRYPWLHDGEISVLCLGLQKEREHARYICIIDERARTLKDRLHIRIHGSIGLLLWQKKCRDLTGDECHDLYKRVKESSFRITDDILAELIR